MRGRSLKTNIAIINERVRLINEKLGSEFFADYDKVTKLWHMYEYAEDGLPVRNSIGFDAGKTMDQMYEYTEAFFSLFNYLRWNPKEIKW